MTRRIVCAALRRPDNGAIICGPRHYDHIMRNQIKNSDKVEWSEADQGFVDTRGHFFTREEAFQIAKEANQLNGTLIPTQNTTVLYSEHLY